MKFVNVEIKNEKKKWNERKNETKKKMKRNDNQNEWLYCYMKLHVNFIVEI